MTEVRPDDVDLMLIGRAVTLCNNIEQLARGVAVLPLQRMVDHPLEDLLLGSRGTGQAQHWLKTTAQWAEEPLPWVAGFLAWMKRADRAIERRNDLLHRPVGLRIGTTAGATLRLRKSRKTHEIETLTDQYRVLVQDLEKVWEEGVELRSHIGSA